MVILNDIRTEVKDTLIAEGIHAVSYVAEILNPPVAVVVPANPYVLMNEGAPFSEMHSVGIHVMLITSQGSNESTALELDSMIQDVVSALDDWDVTEVTGPQEMSLRGVPYIGAVVTLETNTNLYKEVM